MKKQYLLIPGFPPVSEYYKEWAAEIEAKYSDVCVEYADTDLFFSKKLNYVEYNEIAIKHYENVILKLFSTGPVTIIGHSTGGYFALRLLERNKQKIEKIVLICPYIGNSTMNFFKYAVVTYWIDRFLPLSQSVSLFINLFKKYFKYLNELSLREINVYFRFGFKQNTYFNKTKFNTKPFEGGHDKIIFYYVKDDTWCPESTIELLKSLSCQSRELPISHGFILNKNERAIMAQEIFGANIDNHDN
ncbi:MAG: alpha/beta fold hydrolase [Patescibacteria group bacterium]